MEKKKCNRVFGVKILCVCGATLLCLSVVIHIFGNPLFRYKLNQVTERTFNFNAECRPVIFFFLSIGSGFTQRFRHSEKMVHV